MRRFALALNLVAVALMAGRTAPAQSGDDFVIIVNPANDSQRISKDDVARFFLKRTTRWQDGTAVMPVDLPRSSPVREAFSRRTFGKSTEAMVAYWQQQIFSGRAVPPPELKSEAEVVAYVRETPGAIGYVSRSADVRGVRVGALQ